MPSGVEHKTYIDKDQVLEHVARALSDGSDDWRPGLYDSLLEAAERSQDHRTWERAIQGLISVMEDEGVETRSRLVAAIYATRRASATHLKGRMEALKRLGGVIGAPPFDTQRSLCRTLLRLGVPVAGKS